MSAAETTATGGRSNVRVVVRCRPTPRSADDAFSIDGRSRSITVTVPRDPRHGHVNNLSDSWAFKFPAVLVNASQQQVFDECVRDLAAEVLAGYNATVLAYGQTGSGKTHTMTGGMSSFDHRGLIPRAVSYLFKQAQMDSERAVTVRVSYLEIYNEQLYDLLALPDSMEHGSELTIQEGSAGETRVKGLSQPVAASEEEALNLLFEGESNRAIAEHQLNKASTRSHCVFTLHVETQSRGDASAATSAKLHLVDLAGSERLDKTGSDGVVAREATYINKSLTFLEQVVVALCDKRRDHVPYRQSKLTNMLKDSLGGNCKTCMVACIWPEARHAEETVSTLKLATRMMRVRNQPVVNTRKDASATVLKLEAQVAELQAELCMYDTLAGRVGVPRGPLSGAQRAALVAAARAFVQRRPTADTEDAVVEHFAPCIAGGSDWADAEGRLKIVSLRQAQEMMLVLRDMVLQRESHPGAAAGNTPPLPASRSGEARVQRTAEHIEKPSRAPLDTSTALEEFQATHGCELAEQLAAATAVLRERKRVAKEAAVRVNACKSDIDGLMGQLHGVGHADDEALGATAAGDEISTEEKGAGAERQLLVQQLRRAKKCYRAAFAALQEAKSEAGYQQRIVEATKQQLAAAFREWEHARKGASQPTPRTASFHESERHASDSAASSRPGAEAPMFPPLSAGRSTAESESDAYDAAMQRAAARKTGSAGARRRRGPELAFGRVAP